MSIPEISVQKLNELRNNNADIFILDVRNLDEYHFCNLGGHLIPLKELPSRLHELNSDNHIIVHCHSGGRSLHATQFLMQQGFKNVHNLRGGITAWATEIDLQMPKY